MNDLGFGDPPVNGEIMRNARFRAAQSRVAVLMFMILGINLYVSFVPIIPIALQKQGFYGELSQAIIYLTYMALPVFLFGIVAGRRPAEYFSFRRGKKGTFAVGVFTLGVVYFAQLVAAVVSAALTMIGADPSLGAAQPTGDPAVFILRVIYIAVFPAVFEELAMRGLVLGELLPFGKSFAVMTSGVLFALMHMNPVQLPFAFIAGTAMAYAALSCGTLRVSMAVHFINNFLSVLFLSLPEFLSPEISFIAELSVSAVIFAAGTAAGIFLIKHRREEKNEGTALCTVTDEPLRVDLRGGLHGKLSPLLVIYVCAALLITLLTFGMSFLTRLTG